MSGSTTHLLHTWPTILGSLLRKESLSADDTAWVMNEIMTGSASPVQIAGFVVALRAKGETSEEVTGLVRQMLAHAQPVEIDQITVDVVGTGGDGANTVNISTMAALVVAGAGVAVCKHGNRAASSACGAADLLEELGVAIELGPLAVARCVREIGIGFCFAPQFHPGLRHAAPARRQLGIPTIFNFLGPLTNPAQPKAGAIGCADIRMAPILAEVLALRGVSALVMRGEDGLDEFSTMAPTRLWLVNQGQVRQTTLDVTQLGITPSEPGALRGADAKYNADVARRLLAGEPGPVRDAVVLNAAAALAAVTGLGDLSDTALHNALVDGIARAETAIDSGAAGEVLARWIRFVE